MFGEGLQKSGRIRDIEGHVPLAVVVWLEHHPTAMLAAALAASTERVRWLFRLSATQEVQLRGSRIAILDTGTGTRVGSARVHGIRSAFDFDSLPRPTEPPPFSAPEPPFPALAGFACDLDGRVARFVPTDGSGQPGPGLVPRATHYATLEPSIDAMVSALATNHTRAAYPVRAFAARVRDLIAAVETATGTARLYPWFQDERVVVWPAAASDWVTSTLSTLHARSQCLGCSRHDPRDPLARGTYAYSRPMRSDPSQFVRDDVPIVPMDVASAAAYLGRSPAELAATQLPVRFESATKVDLGKIRRAT
jgi:hypothetical protein